MSKSGYDLSAAVRLQETFLRLSNAEKPGWIEGLFATHPPSEERLDANRQTTDEYPSGTFVGKEEYQNAIAPLIQAKEAYAAYEKGVKALENGDSQQAIELAQKALAKEPGEALFHGLAGKALYLKGDFKGAMSSINQAIRLNDAFFDYYLQRGLIAQSQGSLSEARQDLQASVNLLPTADAHYALGLIELKDGHSEDAMEHFAAASASQSEKGKLAQEELAKLEISKKRNLDK